MCSFCQTSEVPTSGVLPGAVLPDSKLKGAQVRESSMQKREPSTALSLQKKLAFTFQRGCSMFLYHSVPNWKQFAHSLIKVPPRYIFSVTMDSDKQKLSLISICRITIALIWAAKHGWGIFLSLQDKAVNKHFKSHVHNAMKHKRVALADFHFQHICCLKTTLDHQRQLPDNCCCLKTLLSFNEMDVNECQQLKSGIRALETCTSRAANTQTAPSGTSVLLETCLFLLLHLFPQQGHSAPHAKRFSFAICNCVHLKQGSAYQWLEASYPHFEGSAKPSLCAALETSRSCEVNQQRCSGTPLFPALHWVGYCMPTASEGYAIRFVLYSAETLLRLEQ